MNKELIKQYKTEFDYWLNGGKLLARRGISDPNDGDYAYTIWYEIGQEGWDIDKVFNYSLEYDKVQIIIDDEYIEFRKALAENKTVEVFFPAQYNNGKDEWADCKNISHFHFSGKVSDYRIKPEEPKFKVGDWVTINNSKPKQFYRFTKDLPEWNKTLNYENIELLNRGKFHIPNFDRSIVKLWEPKPNEWCVFWETDVTTYTVARFHSRSKRGAYITVYGHDFYNIAPLEFIQTLKD